MCVKPILIGGGGASCGQRFAKDETEIAALIKALGPPHPAWFEPTGASTSRFGESFSSCKVGSSNRADFGQR